MPRSETKKQTFQGYQTREFTQTRESFIDSTRKLVRVYFI